MSGIRGVFVGVLALVALEAVVSSDNASSRTAGFLGDVARLASSALDPNVPAIPDRRTGKQKSSIPNPADALVPLKLAGDAASHLDNPAVASLFGPVGLGVNLLTRRPHPKYKPTKPAS